VVGCSILGRGERGGTTYGRVEHFSRDALEYPQGNQDAAPKADRDVKERRRQRGSACSNAGIVAEGGLGGEVGDKEEEKGSKKLAHKLDDLAAEPALLRASARGAKEAGIGAADVRVVVVGTRGVRAVDVGRGGVRKWAVKVRRVR
jgi:hypothetical protein